MKDESKGKAEHGILVSLFVSKLDSEEILGKLLGCSPRLNFCNSICAVIPDGSGE